MKWQRILRLAAVFLAMSGSMLGSDPQQRLQARWSELKKLIGGKAGPDEGSGAPAIWGGIAVGSAIAVLMNLPQARDVTLIEIIPDSPSKREPKTTSKDQSSNTTASEEALALSLLEETSAERIRRQARRAVMRQDLPLDLSGVPVHGTQTD